MATKAAALKITVPARQQRNHGKSFFEGLRRWAQKGQLGSSSYAEASRYAGGRI